MAGWSRSASARSSDSQALSALLGQSRQGLKPTQFDCESALIVVERAEIVIKPGLIEEFLEVLRQNCFAPDRAFHRCLSFRALRGVEDADPVMLLAEWESIEAHLASLPEPAHARFREVVLPYTAGAKATVHFQPI